MNKIKYIAALDGLRAAAVGAVILAHLPFIEGVHYSEIITRTVQSLRLATLGVDLFFVLSGFLISRILINEQMGKEGISFSSFYIKRGIRILPIYALCLLISSFYFSFPITEVLSLSTYTFNLYHPFNPAPHPMEHTWSLSVEEQFYLLWPFIISGMPAGWGRFVTAWVVPCLAVAAAATFVLTLDPTHADELIYMSSVTRMLSLSLGSYLAFAEAEGQVFSDKRCLGLILAGVAILALTTIARSSAITVLQRTYWVGAIIGFGLVSTGALASVSLNRNKVAGILRNVLEVRPLRYVGRISYGLYLYHYPVLFALDINAAAVGGAGVGVGRLTAALGLIAALAVASYHFIEAPLLKLKTRL